MKVINLKDGMPPVNEALGRLQRELRIARQEGHAVVKLVHGYGSKGVGGDIRIGVQKWLNERRGREVRTVIYGENWRVSHQETWELLKEHPELKDDADLRRANKGITVVAL